MANIADKVASIRKAIYGKDVRESIASGIEAINSEVINNTNRQDLIDSQEKNRIDSENIRNTKEKERQDQETIRTTNEDIRIINENDRILNEKSRSKNESDRTQTFNTNESNRFDTFNTNEVSRQNTFNTNENARGLQFGALKKDITDSIDNCNEATDNSNTAISNYNSVVEQTRKIYKPSVNTFQDISITYPKPDIGWTVTSKENNTQYRWDGTEWVDIGSGESTIGYNVVVGPQAPTNPKSIWLEASEENRYSRIIPSITEPDDNKQIWWELDNDI